MTGYLAATGLGLGWIVATLWRTRPRRESLADRLRWYTLR